MFSKNVWRGLSTVAGGFLIHLTLGTFYTIGNMNPYITSYIRRYVDDELTFANGIWLATIFTTGQGMTIGVGGLLQSRIGSSWTCWLGGVVFSAFVALTYFTVKSSFIAMVVTYTLFPGFGCGAAYSVAMMNSAKWFPNHKGLVIGLTVGGFGLGALIFNQVQTFYLNPRNLTPKDDGGDYFTNEDILNRLPSLFLVLAGIYITLQTIGSLLIFEADKYLESVPLVADQNLEANKVSKPEVTSQEVSSERKYHIEKPTEVFKLKIFYSMWIMFALGGETVNFINALYKSFGQSFIADDHLLAAVGSLSSVFNCSGRVMWGKLLDKYDARGVMIAMQGLLGTLMVTFYFTHWMGKVAYTIWVCLIFLSLSGVFTLFVAATARKFGPKYGTTIYCFLFTGPIVTGIVGTPILQIVLKQLGWFKSFLCVSSMPLFGMLLAIFWFE